MAEEDFGSWLKTAIRENITAATAGTGAVMADRHPWMGTVPNGVVTREGMQRLIEGSPEGNVEDRSDNFGTIRGLLAVSGLPFDAQGLNPLDVVNNSRNKWMTSKQPHAPSVLGNQAGYWDIGDEHDPVDSSFRGRR